MSASRWLPDEAKGEAPPARASAVGGSNGLATGLSDRIQRLEVMYETLIAKVDALEHVSEGARRHEGEEQPAAQARQRNINRISFEELRELGLSVNLAARLISQRESRGGFSSLDELDELWGFPRPELANLKRSVTL